MSSSIIIPAAAGTIGLAAYYNQFAKGNLSGNSARAAGYLFNWTTIPFISVANTFIESRGASHIDDTLLISAQPSFWDVPHLVELGIKAVINMCEEYSGPVETYKSHNIIQLRLPTTDHSEPSLETITRAVNFIEKQRKLGHKVLVHCRAGRGRSGAIAFCWLAKTNPQLSLVKIQNLILEKRPGVRKTLYKQPNCVAYYNRIHGCN